MRFCTAADGVRLAYATFGKGPPIVRASTWLTHLEWRGEVAGEPAGDGELWREAARRV